MVVLLKCFFIKYDTSLVFCSSWFFDSIVDDLLTSFNLSRLSLSQFIKLSLILNLDSEVERLDGQSAAMWDGGGSIRFLRVTTNADDCKL